MKKLVLTNERIVDNFRKMLFGTETLHIILLLLLFSVLTYIAVALSNDFSLIDFCFLLLVIFIIGWYVSNFLAYLSLKKGKFRIETDLLMKTKRYNNDFDKSSIKTQAPVFYFQKYGKYRFLTFSYYRLVKQFSETNETADHRIEIGDKFYLVIVGKKIVSVYNTRTFEYQPTND